MIELPYKELEGLSADLIRDHYRLYEGYVRRLKDVDHLIENYRDEWDLSRLSTSQGFLRNAVFLHEQYFAGLTPGGSGTPRDVEIPSSVLGKVNQLALASTGWVVIGWDFRSEDFTVFTMPNHGDGYVASAMALIVVDCYEHAYMPQYGLDKEAYLNAFWANVDWNLMRERFLMMVGA